MDLMDFAQQLGQPDRFARVDTALMLKSFGCLWTHRSLLTMLRGTCLMCQAMSRIQNHLQTEHNFRIPPFAFHMEQLARIFQEPQTATEAYDYCGRYFHSVDAVASVHVLIYEHLCTPHDAPVCNASETSLL